MLKSIIEYLPMKIILYLSIFWNLIFLLSCNKFKEGNCVQASDGYIWKINRIQDSKYLVMGFSDKGWGNEVLFEFNILDKNHIEIKCPVIEFKK